MEHRKRHATSRLPAQGGREPEDLKEPIDFQRAGFAMTIRFLDSNTPVRRCSGTAMTKARVGKAPSTSLRFKCGVAARTDYLIDGSQEATVFLTAAKSNHREGRPFCARTTDGGVTWKFVSFIGEEPPGFAIMPSTVRLRKPGCSAWFA